MREILVFTILSLLCILILPPCANADEVNIISGKPVVITFGVGGELGFGPQYDRTDDRFLPANRTIAYGMDFAMTGSSWLITAQGTGTAGSNLKKDFGFSVSVRRDILTLRGFRLGMGIDFLRTPVISYEPETSAFITLRATERKTFPLIVLDAGKRGRNTDNIRFEVIGGLAFVPTKLGLFLFETENRISWQSYDAYKMTDSRTTVVTGYGVSFTHSLSEHFSVYGTARHLFVVRAYTTGLPNNHALIRAGLAFSPFSRLSLNIHGAYITDSRGMSYLGNSIGASMIFRLK